MAIGREVDMRMNSIVDRKLDGRNISQELHQSVLHLHESRRPCGFHDFSKLSCIAGHILQVCEARRSGSTRQQ